MNLLHSLKRFIFNMLISGVASQDIATYGLSAVAIFDMVNPRPDIIYQHDGSLSAGLIEFYYPVVICACIFILGLFAVTLVTNAPRQAAKYTREQMARWGIYSPEEAGNVSWLALLGHREYWREFFLWLIKGCLLFWLAYVAAHAEWAARPWW